MSKSKDFLEKQLEGLTKENFSERLVDVLRYFSEEDSQIEDELKAKLNDINKKEESNG